MNTVAALQESWAPRIPESRSAQSGVRFHVLIVEDDPDMRALLARYLERAGCTVDRAADGQVAKEMIIAQSFHAMVCDLHMPRIDGASLLRWLRSREAEIGGNRLATLIITAHANAFNEDLIYASGADGLLHKSTQANSVFDEVKRAICSAQRSARSSERDHTHIYVPREVVDLVPTFLRNRKVDVKNLRLFIVQGAFENARRVSHGIKSVGAAYGFPLVNSLGAQLEQAAVAQDQARLLSNISRLEHYLNDVSWESE